MTCIFTRAFTDFQTNLIDQLYSFDYPRTYVEIYFLILFNALVFIIVSLIFRMKSYRLIFIVLQLLIYAYSLSKFLVFYEWRNVRTTTEPYQFDRFDYLAIVFSPLLALGGIFIWILLFSINRKEENASERRHLINGNAEETQPLIIQGKSFVCRSLIFIV